MMFQYNTIIEIGMYRIFYKFLEILFGTRPRPRPRPRQFRSDPAPAPAPAPAKYWTRSVHRPYQNLNKLFAERCEISIYP